MDGKRGTDLPQSWRLLQAAAPISAKKEEDRALLALEEKKRWIGDNLWLAMPEVQRIGRQQQRLLYVACAKREGGSYRRTATKASALALLDG